MLWSQTDGQTDRCCVICKSTCFYIIIEHCFIVISIVFNSKLLQKASFISIYIWIGVGRNKCLCIFLVLD